MKVVIDKNFRISIEEHEDLKSLAVDAQCTETDRPRVARALAAIGGEIADNHAWLPCEWLGAAGDEEWRAAFDGMIAYARTKGWVDETSDCVRAHIVWGIGRP